MALSDKICQTKRIYKFSQSSQTVENNTVEIGIQTDINFPGDNLVNLPSIVKYFVDLYNSYSQLPDM